MEIIAYATEHEVHALKKHFGATVNFVKCDVGAKRLNWVKNLGPDDHVTNIGFCAGQKIGEMYLCNKIIDERSYYPDNLIPCELPQKALKTIDFIADEKLVRENPNMLFDMEAAKIFKSASKYIGPHQISFLKIVSDPGLNQTFIAGSNESFSTPAQSINITAEYQHNPRQDTIHLTSSHSNHFNSTPSVKKQPNLAYQNFAKAIDLDTIEKIDSFINASKKFFAENTQAVKIPNFEKYSQLLRCSKSMKIRLKNLLRYAQICKVDIGPLFAQIKTQPNKTESLAILDNLENLLTK